MVLLRGFLVLVVFFLLGEALRVLVGLPISGGVLGMVMVTATLMLRGRVSDQLAEASRGLISVLVLLISPGVVGVFFIADRFAGHWLSVAVALVAGTLLSSVTTLWLMKKTAADHTRGHSHD
ncbi:MULTISPECIES: CidA/LrgA family protein [Marinobacter]|uniref:CidA/LrgA family protein n=1 Tax=Marinobacter TaxID=2742 RepID=UPI001C949941|nr:CidA/LrgA family protein [Marinobacter nauticus]MBY6193896.1 CidA/LrgA family protein [Marinobacter nauticus]MBY6215043.1 CidA/LrgA family protein [Marinobacter nauticus]